MTVPQFINNYLPYAIEAGKRYGINPIACLAQAAVETAWGEKAPGNNFFGIKANASWQGKTQEFLTTEEDAYGNKTQQVLKFRAYDSIKESFMDYGKLISSLSRYSQALLYPAYNQTTQYLTAIVMGGYATGSGYLNLAKNVVTSIKKYLTESQYTEIQKKNFGSVNATNLLLFGAIATIALLILTK